MTAPRILCAQIVHETNSFSRITTPLSAFEARDWFLGADALAQARGGTCEMSAFIAAAEKHGWILVPVMLAEATPSGPVTAAAMKEITALIAARMTESKPLDGALMALHGAMISKNEAEADAVLLETVRANLRPGAPIAVVLDMHANVSSRLARAADVVIGYRTYPHIDLYDRGAEAAELLGRILSGSPRPRAQLHSLPLLYGCDLGRSSGKVWPALLAELNHVKSSQDWTMSLFPGCPWSDVAHAGVSIVTTTTADEQVTEAAAARVLNMAWRLRHETSFQPVGVDEGVAAALETAREGGRAIIADTADNPGGGGYGDTTALLAALLARSTVPTAFAAIYDPASVQQARVIGPGGSGRFRLGGKWDPDRGGGPLEIDAEVTQLGSGDFVATGPVWLGRAMKLGPVATLRAGQVRIMVTSERLQVADQEYLRAGGLDATKFSIIALKSLQHFRAAFAGLADRTILVDAGGLVSTDFRQFPYRRLRRPIWPLDDVKLGAMA